MNKNRELIILPKVSQAQLVKFLPQLESEGIKMLYIEPKKLGKKKTKIQTQCILQIHQIMWFLKKKEW